MTEKHAIALQILDLLDTMNEGLDYLQKRLQDGYVDESRFLVGDISDAAGAIKYAVTSLDDLDGSVQGEAEEFEKCLESIDSAFEDGVGERIRLELQMAVMPAFKRLNNTLRAALEPLIQS